MKRFSLGVARRWRLWGSGDLVHWWNLDRARPEKEIALDIDTGRRVHQRILAEHLAR